MAGTGRLRKIALLGGASTIKFAPWHDPTWELWSHASCRNKCGREPDILFDLHPESLFRDPTKKYWDTTYERWLRQNHLPIYMQERYPDIPASMRYPFEQIITEFPRGYMANQVAYMIALALQEGVTHIGLYGCHYDSSSEYGSQRGSAEYWLGVAEGRGVQVLIPPGCDLLNKPSLLYGYESHPNGVRDPSYLVKVDPGVVPAAIPAQNGNDEPKELIKADDPAAPPLRPIGVPPAVERRDAFPVGEGLRRVKARKELIGA